LYGHETWFLTLRKEYGLRRFETRVLRMLGHERRWPETGEDCTMRSFVTCTFHKILLVIKSRRVRWSGSVACMGCMRNGRCRHRWENNFGVDVREVG